jgi:hypothetical protein
MTDYVSVHGERVPFDNSGLSSPVPSIGSLGSLRFGGWLPVQIRIGDKITVRTSGVTYSYYASIDLLNGYAWSASVPVYPAIQAAHSIGDFVTFVRNPVGKMLAMNAIVSGNCNSVDISDPTAIPRRRREVLPWVRNWPWATDPYGISWDQSNIMALMLKPVHASVDFDDATAGQPWNIPVPRAIGAEYTKFNPRTLGQVMGDYRAGASSTLGPALADYEVLFPSENRTADSVRSRGTLPSNRAGWQPLPQSFPLVVADPDDATNPSTSCVGGVPILGATHVNTRSGTSGDGPGCRGGRYSLCVNAGGFGLTVNFEIRAIVPGLGDILIHSVACVSGPGFPGSNWGAIYTGTWSGVVLPTDATGTLCLFYVRPDINCSITYNSRVTVAASTNVPWAHHVVTGNDHAPGGLIAPFY